MSKKSNGRRGNTAASEVEEYFDADTRPE